MKLDLDEGDRVFEASFTYKVDSGDLGWNVCGTIKGERSYVKNFFPVGSISQLSVKRRKDLEKK